MLLLAGEQMQQIHEPRAYNLRVCVGRRPPPFFPPQGKKDTPMFFVPTRPLSQPFPAHPPVPSACMFRYVADNSWGGEADVKR